MRSGTWAGLRPSARDAARRRRTRDAGRRDRRPRVCHSTSRQMPSTERLICGRARGCAQQRAAKRLDEAPGVQRRDSSPGASGAVALVSDGHAHARVRGLRALFECDVGGIECVDNRAPGRIAGDLARGDARCPRGSNKSLRAPFGAARGIHERRLDVRRGRRKSHALAQRRARRRRPERRRCFDEERGDRLEHRLRPLEVVEQSAGGRSPARIWPPLASTTPSLEVRSSVRSGAEASCWSRSEIPRGRLHCPRRWRHAVARGANDGDGFGQRDERTRGRNCSGIAGARTEVRAYVESDGRTFVSAMPEATSASARSSIARSRLRA